MLTPQTVHYGNANIILNHRQQTLNQAFDLHPSRFKGKQPRPQSLPEAAWINKPSNNPREVTNSDN